MKSNFAFLESKFPPLASLGALAESYLYSDSNSCLMKLGMIGETIVNLMFSYDHLEPPQTDNAASRIVELAKKDLLPRDLEEELHALRKARNRAVHENFSSVSAGKTLLEMAYGLCEWFMQTYGDWKYANRPFLLPSEKDLDEEREQNALIEKAVAALTEKAQAAAHNAPAVPLEKRAETAKKAASQRRKSEAETRYLIDEQLRGVGWEADTEQLRYSKGARPEKGRNKAIAEWPTESPSGAKGFADYALFAGERLVAFVEAKAMHKDIPSVIDNQCKAYARSLRAEDAQYQIGRWGDYRVPFLFATNGRPYLQQLETKSGIWFLDLRDSLEIPRALRGWMSPEGILERLAQDDEAAARKLEKEPWDLLRKPSGLNLREYQIRAIQAAENAILQGRRRVLLSMATGTGKTRTVLGLIYRFLKTGRFRRILFLVDRTSLGEQALAVFHDVKLEDGQSLLDIYNVKTLDDKTVDSETRLHVATVQSMVRRILSPSGDDPMPSVSDYDLIVVDEAHRGYTADREMDDDELLYRSQSDYISKYRAVMDYFDAARIALTATPALHTVEIFGHPVFNYSYREAVIDGFLVDHDAPHILQTRLSSGGIHYNAGDKVNYYDLETGQIFINELCPDELNFSVEQFNRDIITESFNRAVLREISKDIDPEWPEQGKTLIFAVNNQHADLIVKILREIYAETGVDQDAIVKITASIGDRSQVQNAIQRFKNERFPSVVVTVDLLTTGIDVPEIARLVFLRCVKSRILFEQMMGRATRLCPAIRKDHFEIYDPVGVYDCLQQVSSMRPVTVSPAISYTQLLDDLSSPLEAPLPLTAMDACQTLPAETSEGAQEYRVGLLLAKLQRAQAHMDDEAKAQFAHKSGGLAPAQFIEQIRNLPLWEARAELEANRALFGFLDGFRVGSGRGVIISDKPDEMVSHVRGYGKNDATPEDYIESFSDYIKTHANEIAALRTLCTRPQELTRQSLKSLRMELSVEGYTVHQLNSALSQTKNQTIAADIISIIRNKAIGSPLENHESRVRRAVEKLKAAHSFTAQELHWLDRMEKYLMAESVLNRITFDEDQRFKDDGGFLRINKVFRSALPQILDELNANLYENAN